MSRSGRLVATIRIVTALVPSISANQARSAATLLTRALVKRIDHDAQLADIIDHCYKKKAHITHHKMAVGDRRCK